MPALRLRRLPPLRSCDGAGRSRNQSVPSRRGRNGRCAIRAAACPRCAARSGVRRVGAAGRCAHRRDRVHRLHAVRRGVPSGRHRRRGKTHAYRACLPLHGLWALRPALPGRLHRAFAGGTCLDARRRRPCAQPLRRTCAEGRKESRERHAGRHTLGGVRRRRSRATPSRHRCRAGARSSKARGAVGAALVAAPAPCASAWDYSWR